MFSPEIPRRFLTLSSATSAATRRAGRPIRLRLEPLEDRHLLAPLDLTAFTSLGALNLMSGSYTINTTADTLTGPSTSYTGVNFNGIAVFDFSSVSVASGVTIQATGSRPLAILSQGNMTISGALNGNGQNAQNGTQGAVAGGPGGGGGGQFSSGNQGAGQGPGGGGIAAAGGYSSAGGGGGGFGGVGGTGGTSGGAGGNSYGDLLSQLQGGSGGASGTNAVGSSLAASGGGGGGAIELGAVDTIQITASGDVAVHGGNGAVSDRGASGGGSGGGILLDALTVTVAGTLDVHGGAGGNGGSYGGGGGGGGGRVFIVTNSLTNTATINVAGGAGKPSGSGGAAGTSGGSGTNTNYRYLALGSLAPTQWTVGQAGYTGAIPVSGGNGPYTISSQTGLPPGLTAIVSGSNIVFTGTPGTSGTFGNIQLTVQDANSTQSSGTFSITINPAVNLTPAQGVAKPAGTLEAFLENYWAQLLHMIATWPQTELGFWQSAHPCAVEMEQSAKAYLQSKADAALGLLTYPKFLEFHDEMAFVVGLYTNVVGRTPDPVAQAALFAALQGDLTQAGGV